MKTLNTILLIILTSVSFNASSVEGTESFRVFIWRFFKIPEFQINRVVFPVERFRYVDKPMSLSPTLVNEQILKKDWKHIKGPKHYECESNCSDIRIYDNFEKKLSTSGERALSIEGVENGISSSYYFELRENKWYLVKIEWLST